MRRAVPSKQALLLAVAGLGLSTVALAELGARVVVAPPPPWRDELHLVLGAAPRGSFATAPDARPVRDFLGVPVGPSPILLVGGAAALGVAGEQRPVDGQPPCVAARDGYTTLQEVLLVARYAPVLGVRRVVAVDGEELDAPERPPGWTTEWEWHRLAVEDPLGEWAARNSALARRLLLPGPARALPSPPTSSRVDAYVGRLAQLAALTRGRGVELTWVFAPPASLGPAGRAAVFERAREALGVDVRAHESVAAWLDGASR